MDGVRRNRPMIGTRLRVLFSIKKRREKRIRSSTTHRQFAFRLNEPTSFRGNDCSMLTGTLCLRVPFARAILSYKRSRTIELPVHHRFHLPRTSLSHRAICSILARVTSSESHVRYTVSADSHLRPREIRNWRAFVCMAYVP